MNYTYKHVFHDIRNTLNLNSWLQDKDLVSHFHGVYHPFDVTYVLAVMQEGDVILPFESFMHSRKGYAVKAPHAWNWNVLKRSIFMENVA